MQLVQYSKKKKTSTEALHLNTSVTQQHQHLEKKKKKGNRSGTEKGPALRKRQTEIQRFVGGSQEHLRQMITLHINPPQLTTH